MRRELKRAGAWPLRMTDTGEVRRLGRAAYQLRFAPLEAWLGGVRRLVVVAPDLLHGIPVETLVDSSGACLSDRFAITYAPSALLFARAGESRAKRPGPASWRALLIGDPDPWHPPARGAPRPRLAAAESEVRDIASRMKSPTVLLGAQATGDRLRALAASGALTRFELIHFATHAAVDEVWLGRSALVLAPSASPPRRGPARPDETHDGDRIGVDEIRATWKLDAELVTLAACRTVSGPASSTEGYLGLHQALLGAGARHVLVSLWHVDDRATGLMMSRFYQVLLDESGERRAPGPFREAEALADARRWLRDWRAADGTRPYAHPVYWAGFVLLCGGRAGPAGPA